MNKLVFASIDIFRGNVLIVSQVMIILFNYEYEVSHNVYAR